MKRASEVNRELLINWINKALKELSPGEEYYFNVHSKDDRKQLEKQFKKEIEILNKINPVDAASLHIFGTYKDGRFWVVIRKIVPAVDIGFYKDLDGKVHKIELDENQELKRRLRLMRSDGMTWEEIEEMEGEIDGKLRVEVDG